MSDNQPLAVLNTRVSKNKAIQITSNWRNYLSTKLSTAEKKIGPSSVPKSIFISKQDLDQAYSVIENLAPEGAAASGIRIYFTMEETPLDGIPPQIKGLVVPTYKAKKFNDSLPDLDLIVPAQGVECPDDENCLSIFDFTHPCPDLCIGTTDWLTGLPSNDAY